MMRIVFFLIIVLFTGCQMKQADIQVLGSKEVQPTLQQENQEFVVNGGVGSTEVQYLDEKGVQRKAISNVVRVPIKQLCDEIKPPIVEEVKPIEIPEEAAPITKYYETKVETFSSNTIASAYRLPDVAFQTKAFVPRKPPQIELKKATDEEMLCCDRQMTFRIQYTNVGGDNAYDVEIYDVIPARVVYVEETAGADPHPAKLEIDRNQDSIAQKITWRIPGPIPPDGTGEVYYTVVCPRPYPKLSCSVSFSPVFLKVGEEGKVICRVTNSGNGVAQDVELFITIPQGLEYKGHSVGMQENIRLGNIEPQHVIEKELLVTMRAGGKLDDIVARITAANSTGCECSVPPTPVLTIEKDGPELITNRLPIEYTIAVKNAATKNASATNCVLTDKLPAFTDFKSASLDGIYDKESHTVTWHLGTLKPGDTASRSVIVIPQKAGDFVDHAQVSCDEGITVTDTARTLVRGITALGVSKYDTEDPVEVGNTTTYIVDVVNEGFKEATGLQAVTEIPEGAEFVDAQGRDEEGNIIAFSASGNKVTFEKYPSLMPNAKIVYKVTVKVKAAMNLLCITNITYNEFSKTIIVEEPTHSYQE
ncbi:MAG: DUF11 domain-containing protein [Candidatus Brocadiae bacterium]|nr:DUF11 domain-containing protein [Candidatus Brocadiia bacterium]